MAAGSTHISKLTTRCWSPWQEQQKERELILLTHPSYILGLTPIRLTWVSSPWLNQSLCQGEKIFSYTTITCPSQTTGSGCKSSSDYQSDCGHSNPKERDMLHWQKGYCAYRITIIACKRFPRFGPTLFPHSSGPSLPAKPNVYPFWPLSAIKVIFTHPVRLLNDYFL